MTDEVVICVQIDPGTHVMCTRFWLYEIGCDRSGIRVVLTIGSATLLGMVLPNCFCFLPSSNHLSLLGGAYPFYHITFIFTLRQS
jgi:hypothetical protein